MATPLPPLTPQLQSLARRIKHVGGGLNEIHAALNEGCTIASTKRRLKRCGIIVTSRRLAHLGDLTTLGHETIDARNMQTERLP